MSCIQPSLFDAPPVSPPPMEEGIRLYRGLIEQYNAAILKADVETANSIRQAADELAEELNGGTIIGIRGGPDAVCYVLERATAAPKGQIPLWGQSGEFEMSVAGCAIRFEVEGLYGITPLDASAHAVHWDQPFISETGYRSFLCGHIELGSPGITVDVYLHGVVKAYIEKELKKGKLLEIRQECRDRAAGRAS